jgi:hypothetical protein
VKVVVLIIGGGLHWGRVGFGLRDVRLGRGPRLQARGAGGNGITLMEDHMADERQTDRKGRVTGPGTTSDPNQANREPARDRGAEQVRKAPLDPVPGGPKSDERRDETRDRR